MSAAVAVQYRHLQCIVNAFLMSAASALCAKKKLRSLHASKYATETCRKRFEGKVAIAIAGDDACSCCHIAALSAPKLLCCISSLTLKRFHVRQQWLQKVLRFGGAYMCKCVGTVTRTHTHIVTHTSSLPECCTAGAH